MMSQQSLDVSPPSVTTKRSRSQDSHSSESSRLATSDANGNGQHADKPLSQSDVKIPTYLNQQTSQLQKRFQELEWRQRFRIQHAYAHPETSPFRMDKSNAVVNRNRYGNVQPWDPSRVKLRIPIGGSDYINASPISLSSLVSAPPTRTDSTSSSIPDNPSSSIKPYEMKYIATQGPKDDQFLHFWHMVMQETVGPVSVIVMLTQCYEGIKEKCSQYFPKDLDNPVLMLQAREGEPEKPEAAQDIDTNEESETTDLKETETPEDPAEGESLGLEAAGVSPEANAMAEHFSGSVTLESLEVDPESRCEIRRMRLEIGTETKEVYHYLFNGWPDHGKPEGDDRRALLELTRQTRERAQGNESSGNGLSAGGNVNPRFVHCSAGVGRTGTFIALDWLLSQLEQGNLVPKMIEPDSNLAAFQENSTANARGRTETWGKSGPIKEKESTPEAADNFDLIYDTVNKLREQRMMMVMQEVQYAFLYEMVKEAFVEKYSRAPTVGIVDVHNVEEVSSTGELVRDADGGDDETTPDSQPDDTLSEAETEIEGDPYRAAAPPETRAEMDGADDIEAE